MKLQTEDKGKELIERFERAVMERANYEVAGWKREQDVITAAAVAASRRLLQDHIDRLLIAAKKKAATAARNEKAA